MSQRSRQYYFSLVWNFLEKILKICLGLTVGIYLARQLGSRDFGKINYTLSFIEIFYVLFTLGIDSIFVKLLIKNPEESKSFMGSAFIIRGFSSFLILLIIFVSLIISKSNYSFLILIYGLGRIFQSLNIFELYYQAKIRGNETAKLKIISSITGDFTKVIFLFLGLSLHYIMLAFTIEFYMYFFLLLKKYLKEGPLNFKINFSKIKILLKESLPFIIGGAFITIYSKIDQIMLKNMISEEVVGHYAVSVRLTEFWTFIPIILSSTLLPSIFAAQKSDDEKFNIRFRQLYSLLSLIVFSIILFLYFGANQIITFLYGTQYLASIALLKIQCFSLFFMFIGVALGQWFMAKNLQKLSIIHAGIGCLINIIANYILIPKYQALGASIATLISYAYAGYFYCFFSKKSLEHSKTLVSGTLFSFFHIKEIIQLILNSIRKKE